MKKLFNCILAIFVLLICITCKGHGQITNNNEDKILSELSQLLNNDQKYRLKIMYGETNEEKLDSILDLSFDKRMIILSKIHTDDYRLSQKAVDSLWVLQNSLDSANLIAIESLIKEYGWPSFNNTASDIATAIIIHTKKEYHISLKKLLLNEVKNNRMEPSNYATIIDRLLIEQGECQLYGTIKQWNKEKNSEDYPLILNIENTNNAREKIGLEKLQHYRIKDIQADTEKL